MVSLELDHVGFKRSRFHAGTFFLSLSGTWPKQDDPLENSFYMWLRMNIKQTETDLNQFILSSDDIRTRPAQFRVSRNRGELTHLLCGANLQENKEVWTEEQKKWKCKNEMKLKMGYVGQGDSNIYHFSSTFSKSLHHLVRLRKQRINLCDLFRVKISHLVNS